MELAQRRKEREIMRPQNVLITAVILFLALVFGASVVKAEMEVYDNDGQYLGVLIDYWQSDNGGGYLRLYNETLKAFVPFADRDCYNIQHPGYNKEPMLDTLEDVYYKTTDCSGDPYFPSVAWASYVFEYPCTEAVYRTGSKAGETELMVAKSYSHWDGCDDTCECYQISVEYQTEKKRSRLIPITELPFSLPVTVPFKYQHVSGSNGSGDLDKRLEALEEAFANHEHSYLTGKGQGHNNTTAYTGPPE